MKPSGPSLRLIVMVVLSATDCAEDEALLVPALRDAADAERERGRHVARAAAADR